MLGRVGLVMSALQTTERSWFGGGYGGSEYVTSEGPERFSNEA